MGQIIRTGQAEQDLLNIWSFIACGNYDAADRLLDRLEEAFTSLSNMPEMGRNRSTDLHLPGLRSFPVGKYLILYYQNDDGDLVVLRVAHSARDIGPIMDK